MNIEKLELLIMLGIPFSAFVFMVLRTTGGKVLTGPAMVVSRRADPAKYPGRMQLGVSVSTWNYLVTFRLTDGEEIELYVFEEQFKELKEGLTGQLTWCKDTLSEFIPDLEVTV